MNVALTSSAMSTVGNGLAFSYNYPEVQDQEPVNLFGHLFIEGTERA